MHVDPLAVVEQRFPTSSLMYEPNLLVDVPCPGVEVVDLERDPVQPQRRPPVLHDQPGGLGAQPPAPSGRADECAEPARAIVLVPVVQHDLSNQLTADVVDDTEHE